MVTLDELSVELTGKMKCVPLRMLLILYDDSHLFLFGEDMQRLMAVLMHALVSVGNSYLNQAQY